MLTRSRFFRNTLSIVSVLALAVLLATPAPAQGPSVNLSQLAAQVAADHATITALQTTVNNQAATINNLQNNVTTLQTTVNNQQATVNSQAATIAALQAKTAPISIQDGVGTGTEVFFTGVNVHVVNGLGATDGNPNDPINGPDDNDTVTNGLGNLIIGYNGSGASDGTIDTRTGSHNLILGDANNYTSYAGIIGGQFDTSSEPYASVIGGINNQASAVRSVVTGGADNFTFGAEGVVVGGGNNGARGIISVAVGGLGNNANGNDSVAVGGIANNANGNASIAP